MKIGNKEFDTAKHTYIMGILNVTPDSFSDGGKWNGYEAAMRHAEELLRRRNRYPGYRRRVHKTRTPADYVRRRNYKNCADYRGCQKEF